MMTTATMVVAMMMLLLLLVGWFRKHLQIEGVNVPLGDNLARISNSLLLLVHLVVVVADLQT
jgi:hypothetical protein